MTTGTLASRGKALRPAAYDRELTRFQAAVGEELYANLAGHADRLELAPIYERHAALFSRETVDALAELSDAGGSDAPAARLLRPFAVDGHLERAVADLTDQIQTAETRATIVWRGERIPYRAVPLRVAVIANRAERNALDASYREAVEAINPLREERFGRMRELATELGYADVVALVRDTRGFDPDALAAELERFLAESETVYFAALRRYLALIDIEQGDASIADLSNILRGSGWDRWFEARRLLPVLSQTLAGLEIDLAGQRNVTLDLEARPRKSSRAFCVALRVPQDVRMVVQPRGGWDDYSAAFHEVGHVEHFAHVAEGLPAGARFLGDPAITEGYAFLFDHLLLEPEWLAEQIGMADAEVPAFLDFAALRRLYMLRRYTAKLLYELRLHRSADVAISRAYYGAMLGLLTGVRHPEASYLADVDDGLYTAHYLRAWLFAASLADGLRGAGDGVWWRSASVGQTLRRVWREGQPPLVENVVARLGYDPLDWRPILREIRTQLIGEMSGYGGPNITTRAGTRKV